MKVFRYEVPVDDEWHVLPLHGRIVHVAARSAQVVEVWAMHFSGNPDRSPKVRVFGTGQEVPNEAVYLGTALAPMGLVWHLFAHDRAEAKEATR